MNFLTFQRNKKFGKALKSSRFRRLAIGSWGSQGDPTIYCILDLNVEKVLEFIAAEKEKSQQRITITHFIGKVWAKSIEKFPELNTEIRWGQFYPRESIDVAFQIAIEKSMDLSTGVVRNVNKIPLSEVAKALNHDAHNIRGKDDPAFRGIKKTSGFIPGILQRPMVKFLQFVLSGLNLWSPLLGIPKNAFGSMMITNVGSLGLDFALPALFPPAGVPIIIAVGAIYDAPVYEKNDDGTVKVRLEKHLKMCGTFDHRYMDGLHGSKIAMGIREYFKNPESLES